MTNTVDPAIVEPIAKSFEYTVRLNVTIPLAWAKVLKTTGAWHYDAKCRTMAECGVVNALYNIAMLNEDPAYRADSPESWPSTHPVSWRDCDGMLKIMEQAHYDFDIDITNKICAWLHGTMWRTTTRHSEIAPDVDTCTTCGAFHRDVDCFGAPIEPAKTEAP
jgi:hypothetical protein